MNTTQIAYALEQDPTSKLFCGVFPSDKLPQTIDKYPCGLVANTDPSTSPGAHWVSILMTSRQNAEWFDSYGKPFEFYGPPFTTFLNMHCDQWELNDRNYRAIGQTYVDTIVYST